MEAGNMEIPPEQILELDTSIKEIPGFHIDAICRLITGFGDPLLTGVQRVCSMAAQPGGLLPLGVGPKLQVPWFMNPQCTRQPTRRKPGQSRGAPQFDFIEPACVELA